jgi:hypothetical protein
MKASGNKLSRVGGVIYNVKISNSVIRNYSNDL